MKNIITTAFATLTLCACGQSYAQTKALNSLKINEIQVLGTHNSYAQPVDSTLMAFADPVFEKAFQSFFASMTPQQLAVFNEYHPNGLKMSEGLQYNHPPFDVQLDAGLRSLEIDVYNDPTGNRFNHPAGYRVLEQKGVKGLAAYDTTGLAAPGFKVMHIADFDFRTHYPTLHVALLALKSWSDHHSGHMPIYIVLEAKDKGLPVFPNSAEVLPFDEKAFDDLDKELVSVIGKEKIITPDEVRGKYPTLRDGVMAKNWPTVEASRGKFIFLLLPSSAGMSLQSPYTHNRPNLEKRMMFVQSMVTDTFGAFLLLDNAIVRQKEIQEAVKSGFIVRTRSDIETYEAKVNDQTRAVAAFASGAQVVTTDFFRAGNKYGTKYVVTLPGGGEARKNPVNTK